jgi:glutathione S-transferase
MSMKLYGHYASQPFRSVAWLLKIEKIPFEHIKVEPLAGGTRKPDFISKFPLAKIPALEEGDLNLSECSAILQYIAESRSLHHWWPSGAVTGNSTDSTGYDRDICRQRARLNEYLSSHHSSVRELSSKAAIYLFKEKFFKKPFIGPDREKAVEMAMTTVKNFDRVFLKGNDGFIQGFSSPTIADLMAYTEIAQLQQLNFIQYSEQETPNLVRWLEMMKQLPEHDDVHQTLFKISAMK